MSKVLNGDCLTVLKSLEAESVNCCVTSPPYWGLRDYGHDGQLGLESTPEEYVAKMVEVFREVKRVLKDDGTLWLNLGDSYASTKEGNTNGTAGMVKQKAGVNDNTTKRTIPKDLKPKDLCGIPWRVAFALQADGWYLRQDIIWHKPNPMPESVTDRCTKSHEYIFLLSKLSQYYFDSEAIKERSVCNDPRMVDGFVPKSVNGKHSIDSQNSANRHKSAITPGQTPHGKALRRMSGESDPSYPYRNKRSVWSVTTSPYSGAHFATFPEELIEPCIRAGCPEGGTVLDPFFGAGTTGVVCKNYRREYLGIEINPEYVKIAEKRLDNIQVPFL